MPLDVKSAPVVCVTIYDYQGNLLIADASSDVGYDGVQHQDIGAQNTSFVVGCDAATFVLASDYATIISEGYWTAGNIVEFSSGDDTLQAPISAGATKIYVSSRGGYDPALGWDNGLLFLDDGTTRTVRIPVTGVGTDGGGDYLTVGAPLGGGSIPAYAAGTIIGRRRYAGYIARREMLNQRAVSAKISCQGMYTRLADINDSISIGTAGRDVGNLVYTELARFAANFAAYTINASNFPTIGLNYSGTRERSSVLQILQEVLAAAQVNGDQWVLRIGHDRTPRLIKLYDIASNTYAYNLTLQQDTGFFAVSNVKNVDQDARQQFTVIEVIGDTDPVTKQPVRAIVFDAIDANGNPVANSPLALYGRIEGTPVTNNACKTVQQCAQYGQALLNEFALPRQNASCTVYCRNEQSGTPPTLSGTAWTPQNGTLSLTGKWWLAAAPSGGGDLTTTPTATSQETTVNYGNYGGWTTKALPSGIGGSGQFYARYTGTFTPNATGTWTFGTNNDDGANLYVNGTQLVNHLADGTDTASASGRYLYSGTISLTAGVAVPIVVEWYENGIYPYALQLLCTPPGAAGTISPPASPTLGSTAGGSLAATTYYGKATYVNAYGETVASAESSLAVGANNLLTMASPPASGNATGWYPYVGTSSGSETRQVTTPIAIGTAWTEPTTGLIAGANPPTLNTTGTTQFAGALTATASSALALAQGDVVLGVHNLTLTNFVSPAPNISGLIQSVVSRSQPGRDKVQDVYFSAIEPDHNAALQEHAFALATASRQNTSPPTYLNQYCVSSNAFDTTPSSFPATGFVITIPTFTAIFARATGVSQPDPVTIGGKNITLTASATNYVYVDATNTWTIKTNDPTPIANAIFYGIFYTDSTSTLGFWPKASVGINLPNPANLPGGATGNMIPDAAWLQGTQYGADGKALYPYSSGWSFSWIDGKNFWLRRDSDGYGSLNFNGVAENGRDLKALSPAFPVVTGTFTLSAYFSWPTPTANGPQKWSIVKDKGPGIGSDGYGAADVLFSITSPTGTARPNAQWTNNDATLTTCRVLWESQNAGGTGGATSKPQLEPGTLATAFKPGLTAPSAAASTSSASTSSGTSASSTLRAQITSGAAAPQIAIGPTAVASGNGAPGDIAQPKGSLYLENDTPDIWQSLGLLTSPAAGFIDRPQYVSGTGDVILYPATPVVAGDVLLWLGSGAQFPGTLQSGWKSIGSTASGAGYDGAQAVYRVVQAGDTAPFIPIMQGATTGVWEGILYHLNNAALDTPGAPTLSAVAGGTIAATTYYGRATYVYPGGESVAGPEVSLAVAANNVLSMASPPANGTATGWYPYVSTSTGTETKQVTTAIPIGTGWTEPTTGLVSGAALPTGSPLVNVSEFAVNQSAPYTDAALATTIANGLALSFVSAGRAVATQSSVTSGSGWSQDVLAVDSTNTRSVVAAHKVIASSGGSAANTTTLDASATNLASIVVVIAPGSGTSTVGSWQKRPKKLVDLLDGPLAIGSIGQVPTSTGSGSWTWQTPSGGGGGGVAYDAAILAETSLVHFWKMNDAVGSTTAADSKGSTSLTLNGNCVFNSAGLLNDGEGCLYLPGGSASDNVTLPLSTAPAAASSFSYELLFQPFSTTNEAMVCIDGGAHGTLLYTNAQLLGFAELTVAGHTGNANLYPGSIYHIAFTYDGTTVRMYLNACKVLSIAYTYTLTTTAGAIGGDPPYNDTFGNGRFAKLAIYNATLTQAQISAHVLAMGL